MLASFINIIKKYQKNFLFFIKKSLQKNFFYTTIDNAPEINESLGDYQKSVNH